MKSGRIKNIRKYTPKKFDPSITYMFWSGDLIKFFHKLIDK